MRHVSPELRYVFPMQLMWEFHSFDCLTVLLYWQRIDYVWRHHLIAISINFYLLLFCGRLQHANLSALGTLRNAGRCLHVAGTVPQLQLLLTSCHSLQVTQWHLHHESGQLSTEQRLCLAVDAAAKKPQLSLEPCRAGQTGQHWLRRNTQLQHARTHLCLDNPLKDQLLLSRCRPHAVSQSFQFALEMEAQS